MDEPLSQNHRVPPPRRTNKKMLLYLLPVILVMFGVTFAQVPLFRIFCQRIGIAISPLSSVKQGGDGREVKVLFTGVVAGKLPVYFKAKNSIETVKVGERFSNEYHFVNMSDDTVYFRPVHSILPEDAAKKFTMTKCFCFDDQTLAPHEERTYPVISILSNDLNPDVQQVTLNYTLFQKEKDTMEKGRNIPGVEEESKPVAQR